MALSGYLCCHQDSLLVTITHFGGFLKSFWESHVLQNSMVVEPQPRVCALSNRISELHIEGGVWFILVLQTIAGQAFRTKESFVIDKTVVQRLDNPHDIRIRFNDQVFSVVRLQGKTHLVTDRGYWLTSWGLHGHSAPAAILELNGAVAWLFVKKQGW